MEIKKENECQKQFMGQIKKKKSDFTSSFKKL